MGKIIFKTYFNSASKPHIFLNDNQDTLKSPNFNKYIHKLK